MRCDTCVAGTRAQATADGGAAGLEADAAAWKYWEQPSDGSEFLCPFNTSGLAEVVRWGGSNLQRSASACAASCKCAAAAAPGPQDEVIGCLHSCHADVKVPALLT